MKKTTLFLIAVLAAFGLLFGGCANSLASLPEESSSSLGFVPPAPRQSEAGLSLVEPEDFAYNWLETALADPIWKQVPDISSLPKSYYAQFATFCARPAKDKPTINVWVKKDWGNETPQSISIQLYQNDVLYKTETGTGQGSIPALKYDDADKPYFEKASVPGRRLYSFANLPVYDSQGAKYVYSVKEAVPEGYVARYSEIDQANLAGGRVTITESTERVEFAKGLVSGGSDFYYVVRLENIKAPEKVSLTISKVWDDNNDFSELRPESISVTLKADGEAYGAYALSAPWTLAISDLPAVNEAGEPVSYSVTEAIPANYVLKSIVPEGNTITLTNAYSDEPPVPPVAIGEVKNLWVKKDWGTSPKTKITINVYQVINGVKSEEPCATKDSPDIAGVPLLSAYDARNSLVWDYSNADSRDLYQFLNIPIGTKENPIEYIVEEVVPAGYEVYLPWESNRAGMVTEGDYSQVKIDRYSKGVEYSAYNGVIEYYNNAFYYVVIFQNKLVK
ncbi:Cna B-type domain-containing protein [Leadbettera azotonutricia]|uniref:Putative cell wall surface anchor family protein n=1 Tax=Leadbettera azotonutricia (strain ATCC BAA-888 / DSM 13862 / ZAS-9) TaxID=545695 RepID=F5YC33_LEAAZ|nr:Cna B-type domain-containing protein [Leadbettera azotonutricia]AEF83315.1 putative cell wall surface anchor family protein [Leadbettera azotonutricia ZAS-9]